MMNLFNLFKKKEPPGQGGAIGAMNALSDAMQNFANNFLYGVPDKSKPVYKEMLSLPEHIYKVFFCSQNLPNNFSDLKKNMDFIVHIIYPSVKIEYVVATGNVFEDTDTLKTCNIAITTSNDIAGYKTLLNNCNFPVIETYTVESLANRLQIIVERSNLL